MLRSSIQIFTVLLVNKSSKDRHFSDNCSAEMQLLLPVLIGFVLFTPTVLAWTQEELAVFDLVEEVNQNFYELFEITPTAPLPDVKKAYRKLSLVWHPDRNPAADASNKFRQVAAVYDVLKDENLRKVYDDVLVNGLPDWKQPIFYYRRMRKMPAWELSLITVMMLTLGHFIVLWAAYWEKKFTLEETVGAAMRKRLKRKSKKVDVDELVSEELSSAVEIHRPHWRQLLPFSLTKWLYTSIVSVPEQIRRYRAYKQAEREEMELQAQLDAELMEEEQKHVRIPKSKRNKTDIAGSTPEDAASLQAVPYATTRKSAHQFNSSEQQSSNEENSDEDYLANYIQTGDWTIPEVVNLIRFMQKIPVGTPNRWEKIAEHLNRKHTDVTTMFGKLKHLDRDEYQKLVAMVQKSGDTFKAESPHESLPSPTEAEPVENVDDGHNEESPVHIAVKRKVKFEEPVVAERNSEQISSDSWTSVQQKCLEEALVKFPKGTVERWENIADFVPHKSKDQCITRYKELAEAVRKKKANV